ncbi:PAS domain-containing protein [Salinarchaeum sp. Harcht-Bsk1]|uniref:PAS domain-containing protein n=1 Tax=Salinarchaeum sp. Harcht-Bsk1 TaxID=1333523 RepID=UPI000677D94D|nr:PAS domain-containing protein [Salinarchaeum sp. Harcht-Bsk1]
MPEHPPARSSRVSSLLDRMTEGFLAIDDQWRVVECNGHAAALLGSERVDLLGAELWSVAPDVVETTFADHWQRAMAERESIAFESFWPHTETSYRVRVYPTDDGGIEVYLRDVDARLPDRDGPRHATVVEAVTDGVVAFDAEDRVALVNDAITGLLDASRTTLLGTSLDALSTATKLTDADVQALRSGIEHVRTSDVDDHSLQLSLPDTEGRPGVVEVRLSPLPGNDDRVAAVIRDVTERRDHERIVRSLHAATRELFRAEDTIGACAAAVHTGADLLDLQISGIWLLDEERNRLEPVAATAGAHDVVGGLPVFGDGEGHAWTAYQRDEVMSFDDVTTTADLYNPDTPIRSELIVPIGNHGLLMAGDTEIGQFDDTDVELAEILAANTEAVLDRLQREQLLEERATELERQNERLASLEGVLSGPISATLDEVEETFDSGTIEEARDAVDRGRRLVDVAGTYASRPDATSARTGLTLGETLETAVHETERQSPTVVVSHDGTLRADHDHLLELFRALVRNATERDASAISLGVLQATSSRVRRLSGFYVEDDGDVIPRRVRDPPFDPYAGDVTVGLELELARLLARDHGWELTADPTQHGMRFEITDVTTLSPTKE